MGLKMSNLTNDQEGGNAFQDFSVADPGSLQAADSTAMEPIDFERFRVDPAVPQLPSTPANTGIEITRPKPNWIIRTHVDRLWCFITLILRDGFEFYVVDRELAPHLVGLVHKMVLIPTITTLGQVFLWPIRLPNKRGKLDRWNTVALEAKDQARETWLRIAPNDELETYTVECMKELVIEPKWPDLTFEQILQLALPTRLITSMEHPVINEIYKNGLNDMR
jgi:hypothetical protein